jgi:hypothetical protein
MKREGFDVARCTVGRLMKAMGLQDTIGGKPHRTTSSDMAWIVGKIDAAAPLQKPRGHYKKRTA